MICRICRSSTKQVLELGSAPPANYLLDDPNIKENAYPLILEFCPKCSNIQLKDCLERTDLYSNYFYSTPESITLSSHYKDLTEFLLKKDYLKKNSFVLEIGSNTGNYLKYLRNFVENIIYAFSYIRAGRGVRPLLGIVWTLLGDSWPHELMDPRWHQNAARSPRDGQRGSQHNPQTAL